MNEQVNELKHPHVVEKLEAALQELSHSTHTLCRSLQVLGLVVDPAPFEGNFSILDPNTSPLRALEDAPRYLVEISKELHSLREAVEIYLQSGLQAVVPGPVKR